MLPRPLHVIESYHQHHPLPRHTSRIHYMIMTFQPKGSLLDSHHIYIIMKGYDQLSRLRGRSNSVRYSDNSGTKQTVQSYLECRIVLTHHSIIKYHDKLFYITLTLMSLQAVSDSFITGTILAKYTSFLCVIYSSPSPHQIVWVS